MEAIEGGDGDYASENWTIQKRHHSKGRVADKTK